MKGGLSKSDFHNFNIYLERGMSVEDISKIMRIHIAGLLPHMPDKPVKTKEPTEPATAKKRVVKKKAVTDDISDESL